MNLICLNSKELDNLIKFRKMHEHDYETLIIESQGTGIGNKIIVTCNECEESKDITDYDSW